MANKERARTYTPKTAEEKQQEIEKLTQQLQEKIDGYFESPENLIEHLKFMSNFHKYSLRNMTLIDSQFNGAQAVGSFKFWQSKGVKINKGEKGIKILVPTPVEYFKRGLDKEGKPNWVRVTSANAEEKKLLEKGKLEKRKVLFFKVGHVFEFTQTNAREKGLEVSKIFGRFHREGTVDDKEFMKAFEKLANKIGVTILDEPPIELGVAKGASFPELKAVALNPRNTLADNIPVMIHELAHAQLHSSERKEEREKEGKEPLTSAEKEFQAEMIAYVVASRYDIPMEDFSLPYLAGWTQGTELPDKEELLNEVRQTASEFIDTIDTHFEQVRLLQNEINIDTLILIEYDPQTGDQIHSIQSKTNLDSFITSKLEQSLEKLELSLQLGNEYQQKLIENKIAGAEELLKKDVDSEYIDNFNKVFSSDYALIDSNQVSKPKILVKFSEHPELQANELFHFPEGNERFNEIEQQMSESAEKLVEHYKSVYNMSPLDGEIQSYKARYNVLIPSNGEIQLVEMPTIYLGEKDGSYISPFEQMMSQEKVSSEQINEILNDTALFVHEKNNGSPLKIEEPAMLIHGYMKQFDSFGIVNNADYESMKEKEVRYTVAMLDKEKGIHVFSGKYENSQYVFPLHHMEKIGVDKEIYSKLEDKWHQDIQREETVYLNAIAPRIKADVHKTEKAQVSKKEPEIER